LIKHSVLLHDDDDDDDGDDEDDAVDDQYHGIHLLAEITNFAPVFISLILKCCRFSRL